jgi:hypothetical protein
MTTENQKITISQSPTTISPTTSHSKRWVKNYSSLEENKGISIKPLSLRPNRSIKKNLSLKPTGLGSR